MQSNNPVIEKLHAFEAYASRVANDMQASLVGRNLIHDSEHNELLLVSGQHPSSWFDTSIVVGLAWFVGQIRPILTLVRIGSRSWE